MIPNPPQHQRYAAWYQPEAPEEASAFDTIKEALWRDWQQTKHDLGLGKAPDLNQDVVDTVLQGAGARPVPPPNAPTPPETQLHEEVERALRYGFVAAGALPFRAHQTWSETLRDELKRGWEEIVNSKSWDEVEDQIRYAFEHRRGAHRRP